MAGLDREFTPRKLIVLFIDGDELIRIAAHEFLHRIPDEPIFLRRALIEVEPVSGIEHLRAVFARFSRSQPSQHAADRRVAVDHVVVALINDLFELLVGSKILR